MLVLGRRPGETICVGNDIRFVVVEVKGKRVRIGIEAPANVPVVREELADRRASSARRNNKQPSGAAPCG